MIESINKLSFRIPIIVRYLASGSTGAFVNIGTLYLLADVLGMWYLSASMIAFSAALMVSFTLQKFVTFRDSRLHLARKQFVFYVVFALINLGLNTLFVFLLTDKLGVYHIFSQIIVSIFIAVESFFVYKLVIFHGSEVSEVKVEI